MRTPRTIVALATGLGIALWVLDAAFDAVFFYEGQSFLGLLATDVPAHELYVRSLILLVFVGFGFVVARQTERVHERERDVSLFRRLIDEATDSVFVIDPGTGRIVDVNDTACTNLGYDRSELLELSPADINPEFEDKDAFRTFMDSGDGETLEYYETTHVRSDGTTVPVEISAETVELDGRRYRIAIARDITERKARERQITHYKQAVESSRDLLTAVDAEFRFLFANEAYRTFHGIEAESIRGQSLEGVLDAGAFETVEPYLCDALSGERVQFEMTRTDASGDERVLDVRYWPLRNEDGAIKGVGASLRDVTDRKEMVEDLRRSRERYESLFDSIRDAILVADTDRRIVDCNPAFTELFGYRLEEIEGKPTSVIYESDAEFEAMGESLRRHAEDPTFVQTINYQKKSGQVFPGETNVFYLRAGDGEVEGFIGLIRDVSDRQARVTQLRTIDRVLRHNLNNALTVVLGNAEFIAENSAEATAASAERIVNTCQRLQTTAEKERKITAFLAASRPTVERDIVAIVETVAGDIRDRYPEADLTLDLPPTQRVLAVEQIDRAIEELLDNAVRHSDREEPTVTVGMERTDDTVAIRVADDGPGIPEMERELLTGEREVEQLYHGRGVGLWLVHLIVQYSEGTLVFNANEPRGSVVTIRLPVTDG